MVRMSSFLCRHVLTDNTVPKDAFKGAKGVVFLQAAAAAVGLTAFRGQGFIVAKVDGAWSAPAFIRLSTMGMGFSLGGAWHYFSSNLPGIRHALALPSSALRTLTMAKGMAYGRRLP